MRLLVMQCSPFSDSSGSNRVASGIHSRNQQSTRIPPQSSPCRMTPELTLIIAVVAGTVLVIAAAVMWWMNRTPHFEHNESGVLPLFGGMSEGAGVASANVGVMAGGTVRPQVRTPASSAAAVSAAVTKQALPFPPPLNEAPPAPALSKQASPTIRTFTTANPVAGSPTVRERRPTAPIADSRRSTRADSPPETPPETPPDSPVHGHGVPGTMVEGQLVRFSVPQEGTLQFLPGRLEIGAGRDVGREIRFVQVPGPHGTEVSFGRSEGELYRHIQLRDQTVSRSHARMRFADGNWTLTNLSLTNPIVHNGTVVSDDHAHVLTDGDRIEMGEVLFTFRSR